MAPATRRRAAAAALGDGDGAGGAAAAAVDEPPPPPPARRRLRVAFLHPDLGLGGAERLIVDAAVELAGRGHGADIYTPHHDRRRCFHETTSGAFGVHVAGGWLPRTLAGRCIAAMTWARCMAAALWLLWARWALGRAYDVRRVARRRSPGVEQRAPLPRPAAGLR